MAHEAYLKKSCMQTDLLIDIILFGHLLAKAICNNKNKNTSRPAAQLQAT